MSKRHYSFLLFLLLFSFFTPPCVLAEDVVGLKNLSWEEQKNKTRIILESSQPLQYNVTASQTASELVVELANLDLRNLPQELFINTAEVVALQTFPQSEGQKARIVVKLTSLRPHQVSTEGNKLYIDIDSGSSPAPVAAMAEKTSAPVEVTPEPVATPEPEKPVSIPVESQEETESVEAAPAKTADSPATYINDVQISPISTDKVDVVLVGNGSMNYDVFELANPARLVIDVKSVTVGPGLNSRQASGQEILSKVRVAQFQTAPKVVRAVIDLNRKVPYSVSQEGSELRIHLGDQDVPQAKSNGSTSQTEPAPAPEPAAEAPQPEAIPAKPANYEEPQIAEADPQPVSNEQFFSFEPDTSLFAQDTGTATPAPTTARPPQESTAGGMGQLADKQTGSQKQYTGEPFSFDFKDIDIKDLFRFIADISGLNVILDPSVRGSVTLKLTEVPWDQALDLITKNQGLGYTIEGNVIRIAPLSKN